MNNILLIGYRATGKSSVANLLGNKLEKEVFHMDDELVKRIGKINTFVRNFGWSAFRDEESKLLQEISKMSNMIVDCGGGIIVRDENINLMKKIGKIIWLKANAKEITKRLSKDIKNLEQRPSLTGTSTIDEIDDVLNQRNESYNKASDFDINTDNLTILDTVDNIIKVIL